jgi:hypothetical protein
VLRSRLHFSMRTLLAVPVVVSLSIMLLDRALVAISDGTVSISLEFLVLDTVTRMPIDGAEILLIRDKGLPHDTEYRSLTGRNGRAQIGIVAPFSARQSLLPRRRVVSYVWDLVVSREGYTPLKDKLSDFTRDPRYDQDTSPPPITIFLDKPCLLRMPVEDVGPVLKMIKKWRQPESPIPENPNPVKSIE